MQQQHAHVSPSTMLTIFLACLLSSSNAMQLQHAGIDHVSLLMNSQDLTAVICIISEQALVLIYLMPRCHEPAASMWSMSCCLQVFEYIVATAQRFRHTHSRMMAVLGEQGMSHMHARSAGLLDGSRQVSSLHLSTVTLLHATVSLLRYVTHPCTLRWLPGWLSSGRYTFNV